ncbi:heavy-metal-associated domain-containing protein [Candidatus Oscillochloris fontis]|uniref:heavy-metal-associated domain-containing protein n=1 Tax=Candidatus Oscillochloris fontis TaxID=2496868 RepID=UPI00101CC623|nr:heavy-metal-associated domain-containing protein [Candidatus Oscillochloris fontis]
MISAKFLVPAVSCQHCVRAVTTDVSSLAGVQRVEVDLATKIVTVEHDQDLEAATIIAAIQEAGYDEVQRLEA